MTHIDEATWEQLAMRELDATARKTALDHITDCARCTKIWKGVLAVERGARAFDPGVPHDLAIATTRRKWIAAAGLALAAAAVLVLVLRDGSDDSNVRGSTTTIELSAGELPARFAWEPVAGAELYRLELFTETGELAWSGSATQSPFAPPPTATARFAKVTAVAKGQAIATSRLVKIR